MQLSIEISDSLFKQLQQEAERRGLSIEAAAERKLAEAIDHPDTERLEFSRWSNQGQPWTSMSRKQIADSYKSGYQMHPVTDEEFSWHADDDELHGGGF